MAPETALDRIERLFQLLAFAARPDGSGDDGGLTYDELARRLDTDRATLDRDLAQLTDREYYLPAGDGADIQIGLEEDRVRVWTTGHFRRPTRLSTGEAAALDLGLRILAAERGDPELPDRMRNLLDKLARAVPDDVADRVSADGDPAAADSLRGLLVDAARRQRRVRFRYLKPAGAPGANAPEDRSVEPYAVVYGQGQWYVVGRCPERDDVRVFRVDRILDLEIDDDTAFDPPADFDLADHVTHGRVYAGADDEFTATVRYGGRVAPWLLERGEGEPQDDGSILVRHHVSDPGWIVRHVLGYGGEARVIEPEWVAEAVRDAVGRVGE